MKLKKQNKVSLMLLLSLSLFVVSCTTIPDVDLCVEIEKDKRGRCIYAVSEKQEDVDNASKLRNGKTWIETKRNSLIVPSDSWAKLKTYILTMCKKTKSCEKDVSRWRGKLSEFENYGAN